MDDLLDRLNATLGIKEPKKERVPQDVDRVSSPRIASERRALEDGAKQLGIDPRDYATAISYETAGTFDPWKAGPVTKWGQHRGTIQYGEPQRKQFGVYEGQPFEEQVTKSNVKYLKNAGVKPGMTFDQIYAAINGGSVNRSHNTPDTNTGRTLGDNIRLAQRDHRAKALKRYGWSDDDSPTPAVDDLMERLNKVTQGVTADEPSDPLLDRLNAVTATLEPPDTPSGKKLMLPTDKLATDTQLPPVNPTGVPLKTNATVMPPVAEQPIVAEPPIDVQQQSSVLQDRPQPFVEAPVQQIAPTQRRVAKGQPQPVQQAPQPRYETSEAVISDVPEEQVGLPVQAVNRGEAERAIEDQIRIPDSVKSREEASQYVKDTLRAKYGNVNIPERFTILGDDWKPGRTTVVDIDTLKSIGVDTDALISQKMAESRVETPQPNLGLTVPELPEAEAEAELEKTITSPSYSAQQRFSELLSDPKNLLTPFLMYNLPDTINKAMSQVDLNWVASEKDRLKKQYGTFGKAWNAEKYYQNSGWGETATRMAAQTARSFSKNLFSGTAKSAIFLGQLAEDANPLNLVLPDEAKIGVRNLGNYADFLTRLMTAPDAKTAWQQTDWAKGTDDIEKQVFWKATQEFDKAIGEDPVLKGRFLGSLADAQGSVLAFVALGALMPTTTLNILGKARNIAPAISGGMQMAGTGYEEGKRSGLSEADAKKYGVIQGLLGTTEMFGAGAELTKFLKDPIMKRHLAQAILEVGSGVKRELKGEFKQEVFQTTSGKVVLEYLKDKDPSTLQKLSNALNRLPKQLADAVANEGVIAAITGGITGGAGKAAQVVSNKEQSDETPAMPVKPESIPPIKMGAERTAPNPLNETKTEVSPQPSSVETQPLVQTQKDNSGNFEPPVKETKQALTPAEQTAAINASSAEVAKAEAEIETARKTEIYETAKQSLSLPFIEPKALPTKAEQAKAQKAMATTYEFTDVDENGDEITDTYTGFQRQKELKKQSKKLDTLLKCLNG